MAQGGGAERGVFYGYSENLLETFPHLAELVPLGWQRWVWRVSIIFFLFSLTNSHMLFIGYFSLFYWGFEKTLPAPPLLPREIF